MSMPLIDPSGSNAPESITNPPIDELLDKASSKYALVMFAAKRARQISEYYAQLGEGLLEQIGPLVEPHPREKPLSIALREIHEGLLEHSEGDDAGRGSKVSRAGPAETERRAVAARSPRYRR